jgi:hypothetical protein
MLSCSGLLRNAGLPAKMKKMSRIIQTKETLNPNQEYYIFINESQLAHVCMDFSKSSPKVMGTAPFDKGPSFSLAICGSMMYGQSIFVGKNLLQLNQIFSGIYNLLSQRRDVSTIYQ